VKRRRSLNPWVYVPSANTSDLTNRRDGLMSDFAEQRLSRRLSTTPRRAALMRRVRQRNTAPERVVRQLLWKLGGRYRLNVEDLPGRPDIANQRRGRAVFVHGCFWHHHADCGRGRIPTRNADFWREKLQANRRRDQRKIDELKDRGFRVLVVWECELKNPDVVAGNLRDFWFE